jgi:hypothetical protein
MPRQPEDWKAFVKAMGTAPARVWQLTNTRFLVGVPQLVDPLNSQLDPVQKRFRLHTAFNLTAGPGPEQISVQADPNGPYALIEFTGALPRAKLYADWEMSTNQDAVLTRILDPQFDANQKVVVFQSAGEALKPSTSSTNPVLGTVETTHYEPTKLQFKTDASAPSVLLLNDRYSPEWNVYVDGAKETVLRCNYWMRGVQLKPGSHTVEFRFEPPHGTLYVSLASIVAALGCCGILAFTSSQRTSPENVPAPATPTRNKTSNPKA